MPSIKGRKKVGQHKKGYTRKRDEKRNKKKKVSDEKTTELDAVIKTELFLECHQSSEISLEEQLESHNGFVVHSTQHPPPQTDAVETNTDCCTLPCQQEWCCTSNEAGVGISWPSAPSPANDKQKRDTYDQLHSQDLHYLSCRTNVKHEIETDTCSEGAFLYCQQESCNKSNGGGDYSPTDPQEPLNLSHQTHVKQELNTDRCSATTLSQWQESYKSSNENGGVGESLCSSSSQTNKKQMCDTYSQIDPQDMQYLSCQPNIKQEIETGEFRWLFNNSKELNTKWSIVGDDSCVCVFKPEVVAKTVSISTVIRLEPNTKPVVMVGNLEVKDNHELFQGLQPICSIEALNDFIAHLSSFFPCYGNPDEKFQNLAVSLRATDCSVLCLGLRCTRCQRHRNQLRKKLCRQAKIPSHPPLTSPWRHMSPEQLQARLKEKTQEIIRLRTANRRLMNPKL